MKIEMTAAEAMARELSRESREYSKRYQQFVERRESALDNAAFALLEIKTELKNARHAEYYDVMRRFEKMQTAVGRGKEKALAAIEDRYRDPLKENDLDILKVQSKLRIELDAEEQVMKDDYKRDREEIKARYREEPCLR
jgi:hypothetical protein